MFALFQRGDACFSGDVRRRRAACRRRRNASTSKRCGNSRAPRSGIPTGCRGRCAEALTLAPNRARGAADLVCGDIAGQVRQLFLPVDVDAGQRLAEALRDPLSPSIWTWLANSCAGPFRRRRRGSGRSGCRTACSRLAPAMPPSSCRRPSWVGTKCSCRPVPRRSMRITRPCNPASRRRASGSGPAPG